LLGPACFISYFPIKFLSHCHIILLMVF
jgi:hypothetical protein